MQAAFWDQRYAESDYVYGTAPNVFFAETLATLPPGRLLLPCEGEGRNAVYAAAKGWSVQAFDQSAAGRDKALRLARHQGLDPALIDYQLTDVRHFTPDPTDYDLIALIYTHFAPETRQAFFRQLQHWLRPGGQVLLEAFTPAQLQLSSGGPKDPQMLYTAELLQHDFQELDILQLEHSRTHLDEGPFHQGEADVVRLLARRPF